MASMGGVIDVDPVIRCIRSPQMRVKLLQDICKYEGIRYTQKKADLQRALEERAYQYKNTDNVDKFNKLHNECRRHLGVGAPALSSPQLPAQSIAAASGQLGNTMPKFVQQAPLGFGPMLQFKPNPFYTIREQLGPTKTCDTMQQHRNNIDMRITANEFPALQTLDQDKSLRVMLFCAGDMRGVQDIAFPHQSEIKVNTFDPKYNLRGLKNKPGSTRPADLNQHLRFKPPGYLNRIEFTYALTTKKFYLALYLVKTTSVEELRQGIANGNKLTKETVISRMVSNAQDPDIEATSMALSLKCPLSTLRLNVPIRGSACRHNQCFDAESYLQLQEQAPTWQCPICNNPAPFDSLVVDEFVKDILNNTPRDLEQITIDPYGKWSLAPKPAAPIPTTNGNGKRKYDSDDDLIEITDNHRPAKSLKQESAQPLSAETPPISISDSREPSHSTPLPSNKKKPTVIDLTFSDDEDDEPIQRAPKRQSMASSSGGYGPSKSPYLPPPHTNSYYAS